FGLGWHWAALRLAVGLIAGFGVAHLANRIVRSGEARAHVAPTAEAADEYYGTDANIGLRWLRAFWRLFIRLVPEYVVLVLMLGAARAWLFPSATLGAGNSLAWTVGLAVAGMLFVIP